MENRISVALLTHDEKVEFLRLAELLLSVKEVISEIVIVDDYSTPDFCAAVSNSLKGMPLRFFQRHLNKNFAQQRNFMKSMCTGALIFFLDPDEMPGRPLLQGLPTILEMMLTFDVDACEVPRYNGICETAEQIDQLIPSFDIQNPIIKRAFWENQVRIIRNLPHLGWRRRLDEYVVGIRRCYRFPCEKDYALLHLKSLKRAEEGRSFYKSMKLRHFNFYADKMYQYLFPQPAMERIQIAPPI